MIAACTPPLRSAAHRIAVVGAGYAGLAAASTLEHARQCVTVLEAGHRPGGRACTQQLSAELALELGATWFHGGVGDVAEKNPVFQHAVGAGLIDSRPEGETWWSSQFLLPGSSGPLNTAQQAAVTHTLAAWAAAVEAVPQDAGGTTADHLRVAWQQLLASGKVPVEQEALARRAWRWREHLQRAMDGCHSTADQSAQGLALYDEMPGGVHAALPAGMQAVAELLAGQLSDVRYGWEVRRITWGGPGGISIECKDGSRLEDLDAVIVTVSLGVLKAQHGTLFDPPLPADKVAAISSLRIGTVDKVFLEFENSSIADINETATAAVPPSEAALDSAAGPAAEAAAEPAGPAAAPASGSEATTADAVVSYAFLWSEPWEADGGVAAGQAASESQVPDWLKGVFSLRFGGPEVKLTGQAGGTAGGARGGVGPPARQRPAAELEDESTDEEFVPCAAAVRPTSYQAVAWVTGEAALAMEAASDEEVLNALRQLPTLFPQVQLPPGASWDSVKLHRSKWGTDPHFLGSYSYLGPGSTPADVAALAAPVCATAGQNAGAPVLLFAGEACHVKYIGTMHGAYMTGRQQAEVLLCALSPAGG
ncbi:Spermine oxidase [Chlorella vulgaris]